MRQPRVGLKFLRRIRAQTELSDYKLIMVSQQEIFIVFGSVMRWEDIGILLGLVPLSTGSRNYFSLMFYKRIRKSLFSVLQITMLSLTSKLRNNVETWLYCNLKNWYPISSILVTYWISLDDTLSVMREISILSIHIRSTLNWPKSHYLLFSFIKFLRAKWILSRELLV